MPPLFNDLSPLLLEGNGTSPSLTLFAQPHGVTPWKRSLMFRQRFKGDLLQISESPLIRSSLLSGPFRADSKFQPLNLLILSLPPQLSEPSIFAWGDLRAPLICFRSPEITVVHCLMSNS